MKPFFYLLLPFILFFISCSDNDPVPPSVKRLPVTIEFNRPPYKYEIKYDHLDRITLISLPDSDFYTQIDYISDNEIKLTQPAEVKNYKVEGNIVYLNGEKNIEINSNKLPVQSKGYKDYPINYTYDKWGNITSNTYHPWDDTRTRTEIYTSDDKYSPFYFVQSPRWLINELFSFDFGYFNNPLILHDKENTSAGYDFEMEYNADGYPTKIKKNPFGILGISGTLINIEYK